MRKSGILSLLAAAAALTMVLSGCGGEPASQESQESSQSPSASSAPESSSAASESSAPESSSQAAPESGSQSAPPQSSAPASSSQAAPAEPLLYRGEEVLELWALDMDTHTTAPYLPGGAGQPEGDRLEAALNDAPETSSGDAFILFTQAGRQYVYLGEDPSGELSTVWEQVYGAAQGKSLHWLTHMTPEKIVSVETVGLGKTEKQEISHRQTLEEIAAWLKKNLTADPAKGVTVKEGPDNPDTRADGYFLKIAFDTGVEYTLIGYGELDGAPDPDGTYLSLYTSDLDQTVRYALTPGTAAALRTFFGGLA